MKSNHMIVLFFVWFSVFSGCSGGVERIPLQVLAGDGGAARGEFSVELALTPAERSQGLMFRKELGPENGMLFVFPSPSTGAFWMQNTLISLDIIFIGSDKKIINIVARAEPQTTTPREPEGPYLYTLELEGGRAEELGIIPGDAIAFELPANSIVQ